MKITFFIGSMSNGGAERVISLLANHYAKKDWDVEIALLLENKVGYTLDNRIKIVDLTKGGNSYFKNLPFWLKSIRRYLKASNPDKVVSFVGRINALVLMSSIGIKVPVIVSERNDPRHDGRGKAMLWCCNECYKKRASAIVFQTEYELTCFSDSLLKKSHIVPNPVSLNDEPSKPEGLRIVTAGRLTQQKNHAMLIDAISLIKDDFPKMSVDIFGDGTLKDFLQKKIDEQKLGETVTLWGNVFDLHTRIKNASIFVMTSDYEGLSNALIEAMMLGIPCISTDYPGVSEIIEDGTNGILVKRNNYKGLAKAIKQVLTDDALRQKLSENALKTAQNYKTEIVIKKWEDVIEKDYK